MAHNCKPAVSPPPKRNMLKKDTDRLIPPPKPIPPNNITIMDNPMPPFVIGLIVVLAVGVLILMGCVACGVFERAS